jgi:hypothetical protein
MTCNLKSPRQVMVFVATPTVSRVGRDRGSAIAPLCAVALFALACANSALGESIHDAAQRGDLTKVKALLKGKPALALSKDKHGATPLHWAAAGCFFSNERRGGMKWPVPSAISSNLGAKLGSFSRVRGAKATRLTCRGDKSFQKSPRGIYLPPDRRSSSTMSR